MKVFILIVSVAWFPHSLERVNALGYDFTIYYIGDGHPGWLYAPWTSVFFEPLRIFPHDYAFGILYCLSAIAFYRLTKPHGWVVMVLCLYPYLLAQELGNITVILAWACLSYTGSLLAACFKPYLAVFGIVHAVSQFQRDRQTRAWSLDRPSVQVKPTVSHTTVEGL